MKGLRSLALTALAVSITQAQFSWADINLTGDPTLSSSSDVTLSGIAILTGMDITQHTLNMQGDVYLQGYGSISQRGMLLTNTLNVDSGSLLLTDAGMATLLLHINTFSGADSSVSATGAGIISTQYLTLESTPDHQASFTTNGNFIDVISDLNNGAGSSIVVDNAFFRVMGHIANTGTITVTGTWGYFATVDSAPQLGQLHLSGGAHFGADQLSLINSNDHISADGTGTAVNFNTLALANGAMLTLSNGAFADIKNNLINGPGSSINIDNARLSAATLNNQGAITIAGSDSLFEIGDYFSSQFGQIHFTSGAIFNHDLGHPLYLENNNDHLSADGTGTQLNFSGGLWLDNGTRLTLSNGANTNITGFYGLTNNTSGSSITIDDATLTTTYLSSGGSIRVSGNNSQLNITDSSMTSFLDGQTYISNGAVFNSLTNLLEVGYTGLLNVTGTGTQLNSKNIDLIYQATLSLQDGAILNAQAVTLGSRLQHDSSLVASGTGTQLNMNSLALINGGTFTLSNGATANIKQELINLPLCIGCSTVSTSSITIDHATLTAENILNGLPGGPSDNAIITIDNGSLTASTIKNVGTLISRGTSTLDSNTITNNGIIAIDGTLALTGDIEMLNGSEFNFTVGENVDMDSAMLAIGGGLFAADTIGISFNLLDPALLYDGFSLDLITAAILLPELNMFDIDLSAFDFLSGQWTPTVGIFDNRLVLTITSAVPLPASCWLLASAFAGLFACRRKPH